MKIEIEIPKEYERDYDNDKFEDFFSRLLVDIEGVLCGNYEKEIILMLRTAFGISRKVDITTSIMTQLEELAQTGIRCEECRNKDRQDDCTDECDKGAFAKAIELIQNT